jgi:hypothetical protein
MYPIYIAAEADYSRIVQEVAYATLLEPTVWYRMVYCMLQHSAYGMVWYKYPIVQHSAFDASPNSSIFREIPSSAVTN